MLSNRIVLHHTAVLASGLMLLASAAACAQPTEIDSFIAEAPSAVFASVDVGDATVVLLSHSANIRGNGVVSGDVYALAFRDGTDLIGWHLGRLWSDHAAGDAAMTGFVFHMRGIDTPRSQLCYFDVEKGTFRAYTVRAPFIGAMVLWDGVIFYSTEHFDDNLHYVDIDDGEVHMVEGSGETAANSDFWVVDGELIVTDGGDKGIPYRLDRDGLYPAPDVAVSPETKVGFNLRTIRGGEDLERFEELLGIR